MAISKLKMNTANKTCLKIDLHYLVLATINTDANVDEKLGIYCIWPKQ